MKIIGVGNAIVDVICNVNESFLTANDLTKGTMKLTFDKSEFEKMLSGLEIKKTVSAEIGDESNIVPVTKYFV